MLDQSPSNVGTAGLTSLPVGRADSPPDPRAGSSQNAMGKGGESKKSVFSLMSHPKPTPPCGQKTSYPHPHVTSDPLISTPHAASQTPHASQLAPLLEKQGGAKTQHGGVDNHPPASHGGVDNPGFDTHGGCDSALMSQHGGSGSSQKSDMGPSDVPEWLAHLRGFYNRIIASVSRGKPRLEPADWERIWVLYHGEALKELDRRHQAGDREGWRRCYELMQSISGSLVAVLRQQAAELIKRQFKGERIAAEHFPSGDPSPDKAQLFQQWQANFAEVTKALEAMAVRITQLSPDYDLSQDWPSEAWFKTEKIPEGLWAS